jgi:predicted helicase
VTAISDYLKKIEKAYAAGNATEHTHRPALKELMESMAAGITATNEPRRVKCGAPDFIITKKQTPLGYIECKDIGKSLTEAERTDQIKRYRESLGNLILTDYLEFRWYVGGQYRLTVQLATVADGKIKPVKNAGESLHELFAAFLTTSIPTVNSPKELAHRMAALARLIRDIMKAAFNEEDLTDEESDPLHEQLDGFRKVLIHDLTPAQFADMYAQTICYGLFAARCNADSAERFTRQNAGFDLPKTNPFLRKMFDYIAGVNLDERIVWAVDDLAELLHHTDMEAILKDFGKHTRQEDPVVHFYETFLAAYDPKMREARGVYYTPEPVVSYIVRSIDHILKTDFKLQDGLADATKIKVAQTATSKKKIDVHKVQILDPATGTGTFLYGIIDHIYNDFKDDKGMWSSYVSQHLLPRLFGFELLMAPYAVAHMKLGLQLKQLGYDFQSAERLRIYLTNTLEEAHAMSGLPLFTQWIAEEANAASDIKKDAPVMVVLGNPPYSGHSANTGKWISNLLRGSDTQTGQKTGNYFEVDGQPLGEKNPKWLNDDYVKFIRFAQWRIEQTGYGILAFISNNGYLDNPTFRGMRQSLMQTFDDIYILDLHGNSKKKERCPDGSEDKNVFDIQQGVAIGIFIKRTSKDGLATVRHADLWGKREIFEKTNDENKLVGGKYHWLAENDTKTTSWSQLEPQSPMYLYVPQDYMLKTEYGKLWVLTDIMPLNGVGMTTARDHAVIGFEKNTPLEKATTFRNSTDSNEELCNKLAIPLKAGWDASKARKLIKGENNLSSLIQSVLYRPFDIRWIFYHDSLVWRTVKHVMRNMLVGNNIALITTRQTRDKWDIFSSRNIITHKALAAYDINSLFPLYLYPSGVAKSTLFDDTLEFRKPNLSPKFIEEFAAKLKMKFISDGKGDRKKTFGPEDIFNYMYAVLHSPTYRSRYAEFLKMDFPRLPLTSNPELFRKLCALGDELVSLHLMEKQGKKITGYPVAGDSAVETVRYTEPQCEARGRVWINATQYFDGVPKEVWEFHVGGYQVCSKWLKDRKGRKLTYDDLTHYQQIVSALAETIVLMEQIDAAITASGGWPIM